MVSVTNVRSTRAGCIFKKKGRKASPKQKNDFSRIQFISSYWDAPVPCSARAQRVASSIFRRGFALYLVLPCRASFASRIFLFPRDVETARRVYSSPSSRFFFGLQKDQTRPADCCVRAKLILIIPSHAPRGVRAVVGRVCAFPVRIALFVVVRRSNKNESTIPLARHARAAPCPEQTTQYIASPPPFSPPPGFRYPWPCPTPLPPWPPPLPLPLRAPW